jgi:hypothetical protein
MRSRLPCPSTLILSGVLLQQWCCVQQHAMRTAMPVHLELQTLNSVVEKFSHCIASLPLPATLPDFVLLPYTAVRTAEEFALHKIIEEAQALQGDEALEEAIEDLPRSTLDEDFDLVSDIAFQDHDVLWLFDAPQVMQQRMHASRMMHILLYSSSCKLLLWVRHACLPVPLHFLHGVLILTELS